MPWPRSCVATPLAWAFVSGAFRVMPVPVAPAVPTVLTVAISKPASPLASIRSVSPTNQNGVGLPPPLLTAVTLMVVSPAAAGADSVVAVEGPLLESGVVATMLLIVFASSMATGWPRSKMPAVCDALSLLPFATNTFVLPELAGNVRVVAPPPVEEQNPEPTSPCNSASYTADLSVRFGYVPFVSCQRSTEPISSRFMSAPMLESYGEPVPQSPEYMAV